MTKLSAPRFTRNHLYNPKASLLLFLAAGAAILVLFHITSLPVPPSSPATAGAWSFTTQWQTTICNSGENNNNSSENSDLADILSERLRRAVTFLPLKDLRYSDSALSGHTWFMSSLYDEHEEGEVQFQHFPSESSAGRILCLKGKDRHDGSWNSYALAWPETLPVNATLMKGLTFISYNHYNYDNIWHGLSAVFPFVAWHRRGRCSSFPARWVLFHWGELRLGMGSWVRTLMEATFDGSPVIEGFDEVGEGQVACFEEATVTRHNEGGMSRWRRMETYDLMRCKARAYCNVTGNRAAMEIGMTMFMRSGARSFRNESEVVGIFQKECAKVAGCRFRVAYSNNLTFCEQVRLMSETDILVSPHGAQLTNMFLMDRNSSVMEFFPKGWLKLAGVGQFVYHWIASWSGMAHRGAWRDPQGDPDAPCAFPDDDRRCMSAFKSARIGFNRTYFSDWSRNVLADVTARKMEEVLSKPSSSRDHDDDSDTSHNGCSCIV